MKNNKYNMMFFAEDAGGGEGGAGAGTGEGDASLGGSIFNPPAKQGNDRPLPQEKVDKAIGEQDQRQQRSQEGAGAGAGTTGAPTAFDPAKFAKEFSDSVSKSLAPILQKTNEPPPKELTAEEAKKLLNIWEPDEAWYKEYDNLETRKSAVAKMRDGLVRQADTIAQLRMQESLQALRDEISPQLTAVQEFAEAQREGRFNTSYPQLKDPNLQPLVAAVTDSLVKEGKTFSSEAEMFKAVADGVAAVIKVNNPDFKLTAGSNPATEQGRNGNAIPVTSPGSGGGTGTTGAPAKGSTKKGIAVFE